MMQFVIPSDLCFEKWTFCPSFIYCKSAYFREIINILLIDYHAQIYIYFILQTQINTLNNFIESSFTPF